MISGDDLHYAANLKILRNKAGWKQALAAEMIGLSSQQEYSKLEKGQRPFTEDIVQRICKAFKISEAEFKRGRSPKQPLDLMEIINAIRPEDVQQAITTRSLCAMILETRIQFIKSELRIVQMELQQLMPPRFEDVPEDKEYQIYIQRFTVDKQAPTEGKVKA